MEVLDGLTLFETLALAGDPGFTGFSGFADGLAALAAAIVLIGLCPVIALTTVGVFTGSLFFGLGAGLGVFFADWIGAGFPGFFGATED